MADVFISYAREDRPAAEQIARGLQAMGLECFWDTEIPPGQTWADYIEGKLSACKAVIVLWSAHSTGSQWVREEARMGRDKGKLIPAMLDASPAPFGFGEVQAANLSGWTGAQNDPQWARFSNAVHTAVRGADAPPRVTPQPAAQAAPQRAFASAAAAGGETLSPIGYVQKCFRLYVDGKGRARRAEYWWWTLFVVVASIVAYVLDAVLFGFNPYTNTPNTQLVYLLTGLGLLAPGVSVMSRRFHDVGLNGWLVAAVFGAYLIGVVIAASESTVGGLIILVSMIATLVVLVRPSQPGENQYGPNPKGV
jgi:uncharacterized membrane protein YhaH (DUF805 family)